MKMEQAEIVGGVDSHVAVSSDNNIILIITQV